MKSLKYFVTVLFIFTFTTIIFCQNEDAEGCKDHPLFTRVPGYKIGSCENKEFEMFKFPLENSCDQNRKEETVEGKYYFISFGPMEGINPLSATQLYRNFENALKKINATLLGKVVEIGNSYGFLSAKIKKGNNETYVYFHASDSDYEYTIVERQAMTQYIQANAMLDALNKDGFIALDILFDTGKSTIKEESLPIIDQICELLKSAPDMKVSIEGHTDNTGTPQGNKTLSESRAKAVMDAVAAKGIDKSRMSSEGWGQEKPVADNRTEEGRAKNRRVEIVKK